MCLSVQVTPFPVNPGWQLHLKFPTVFEQAAFESQL